MKKIIGIIITAAISAALHGVPAQADNESAHDKIVDGMDCVTVGEFQRLRLGMTKAEVRAILDGPGKVNVNDMRNLDGYLYPACYWPRFDKARTFIYFGPRSHRLADAYILEVTSGHYLRSLAR